MKTPINLDAAPAMLDALETVKGMFERGEILMDISNEEKREDALLKLVPLLSKINYAIYKAKLETNRG